MYHTLEDVISDYVSSEQAEADAKHQQGDVLAAATAPDVLATIGVTQSDLIMTLASTTGRRRTTLYRRLKVARTFAPDQRLPNLSWEHHAAASETDQPHAWLARANDEGLSVRKLKEAIRAAGGNPDAGEPVYLFDGAECDLDYLDARQMTLFFCQPCQRDPLPPGTRVLVTVIIEPVLEPASVL